MIEQQAERRPIGWWLKRADACLRQAFEDALAGLAITRRQWQVLESLARAPRPEAEILRALDNFAGAASAVDQLRDREFVVDGRDGALALTPAGLSAHADAGARVATVREAVATALPADDYPTLIRLLGQLIDGVERSPQVGR
ncbi:MAG: winged helix DNA-binding protein [Candidatus Dormibacteraeota bacterium]|uniref:Winged helix DNA-binding protein n=1 Tax=Candidatus Aeolococcus gillhamiae TaxID=3127015 RepID=A0A2W5ZJ92_9BACT|nr:winged helix DNA-binding protein [Candidatus Dormibacteraeota bacterium]PZR83085.1 MAG: hypothetical protein DLM65_02750 [Candidatus Dormibacter sp. RRmetagenome_bin12]